MGLFPKYVDEAATFKEMRSTPEKLPPNNSRARTADWRICWADGSHRRSQASHCQIFPNIGAYSWPRSFSDLGIVACSIISTQTGSRHGASAHHDSESSVTVTLPSQTDASTIFCKIGSWSTAHWTLTVAEEAHVGHIPFPFSNQSSSPTVDQRAPHSRLCYIAFVIPDNEHAILLILDPFCIAFSI